MTTRAIDPVVLTTTDEQERKFLLTRGALKRIRTRLKVKTLPEVLSKVAQDDDGAMAVFLYECLLDKGTLTLEQFEDVMPFNIEDDQRALAKILGASLPEPSENPPVPLPIQ